MRTERDAEDRITEPWLGFLKAVNAGLDRPIELHCLGGFAVLGAGVDARQTGDINIVDAVPADGLQSLLALAGSRSELFQGHRLYIEHVGVTVPPCDYRDRLIDITPRQLNRLVVKVLDPNDVILTKLARHWERDREDTRLLVARGLVAPEVLEHRFEQELEPFLTERDAKRARLTLDLWLEEFFPNHEPRQRPGN